MKLSRPTLPTRGVIHLVLAVSLIPFLGWADARSGYELAFSPFYFLPIAIVTWYVGSLGGMAAAMSCTIMWLMADIASGYVYPSPWYYVWNSLIRFGSFVVILVLVLDRRRSLARETQRASMDPLTGLANRRQFHALLDVEIRRSQRHAHPLSLAYIDLDEFKSINDRLGHQKGDQVLQVVANALQTHLRREDVAARLGGDEFAVLLPETPAAEAAIAVKRMHSSIIAALKDQGFSVTASIGCVTCSQPYIDRSELVRLADANMYRVKHGGRNAVHATSIGSDGKLIDVAEGPELG